MQSVRQRNSFRPLISIAVLAGLLVWLPGVAKADHCNGDCDNNAIVTIAELMLAVNIALALEPLSACTNVDADGDGMVEIHELIEAVGRALFACLRPAQTPTPTTPVAPPPGEIVVISRGGITTVEGSEVVSPARGQGGPGGPGTANNWCEFNVPGQASVGCATEGEKYDVAYAKKSGDVGYQPVQSNDWWTGVGMQWQGWVLGPDNLARTPGFFNEPFFFQFVDFTDDLGLPTPIKGLKFWNQKEMAIGTGAMLSDALPDNRDGFFSFFGRGDPVPQNSPILVAGLANVGPIGSPPPSAPPWTSIRVERYTDWGVVFSYAGEHEGSPSTLTITTANGSPFVWFERNADGQPFRVWAGASPGDSSGSLDVWFNEDGKIGLTVTNAYNPINGLPEQISTAAYAVYANDGLWSEARSNGDNLVMFANDEAARIVVAAMPHSIALSDTQALRDGLQALEPFAWHQICDTKIHYPPITGSDREVLVNGEPRPLGYDEANSTVRTKLEVGTLDFLAGATQCLPGADGPAALQMVFPHHRKAMIEEDRAKINPAYTWRSLRGELQAFEGNSYVRELTTFGVLPFLPSVAVNSDLENPLSPMASGAGDGTPLAVDDIYETLKQWFYQREDNFPPESLLNSFIRSISTYVGPQTNTYLYQTTGLVGSVVIADQLAQSPQLVGFDADLKQTKREAAAEMRDEILQSLKEALGFWADIYTTGYFQYNPEFSTIYGFTQGFGSVQNISDHHFHWGYFLRAAATVGRYDPGWLETLLPLFEELRADVANYDRTNLRYPFLRNFSPFYGHNWANGVANGGKGNDQESTSEAINFAAALIELGQILQRQDWRDLGMYLYEEEVLASEQYWFNQDANLREKTGEFFNGNWPDDFVHFERDSESWITAWIANPTQQAVVRTPLFEVPGERIAATYIIEALPLAASHLYIGRNQAWLSAAWEQARRELATYPADTAPSPFEVLFSAIQARLPSTDPDAQIDSPGLTGALIRINRAHAFYPGATNTMGKHWAYTNHVLGQLDTSVTADTASYGVFRTPEGTRSYVAYNPTDTATIVTFRLADANAGTGALPALTVPAQTMVTMTHGSGTVTQDQLTPFGEEPGRLYLRLDPSTTGDCADEASPVLLPQPLDPTPGSWSFPGAEPMPFPSTIDLLNDSLVCVPERGDEKDPSTPPLQNRVRTWVGPFRGSLITEPQDAFTRFALYTNEQLFPGWQVGTTAGNTITFSFEYDFDGDGTADRTELYTNVALFIGNYFTDKNKHTQYQIQNLVFGLPEGPEMRLGFNAPRCYQECVEDGTLTVRMWGGSSPVQAAVPVSVDAALVTNRASWVQPPYESETGTPTACPTSLPVGETGFMWLLNCERTMAITVPQTGMDFLPGELFLRDDEMRFCTEDTLRARIFVDFEGAAPEGNIGVLPDILREEVSVASIPQAPTPGTFDVVIQTFEGCMPGARVLMLRMPGAITYE